MFESALNKFMDTTVPVFYRHKFAIIIAMAMNFVVALSFAYIADTTNGFVSVVSTIAAIYVFFGGAFLLGLANIEARYQRKNAR